MYIINTLVELSSHWACFYSVHIVSCLIFHIVSFFIFHIVSFFIFHIVSCFIFHIVSWTLFSILYHAHLMHIVLRILSCFIFQNVSCVSLFIFYHILLSMGSYRFYFLLNAKKLRKMLLSLCFLRLNGTILSKLHQKQFCPYF